MITNVEYVVQTRSHETNKWVDQGPPFATHEEASSKLMMFLDGVAPGFYDGRLRVVERTTSQRTVERIDVTFIGLKKVSH